MKETIAKIKENAPSFGSIPFWSWNDKLNPEELKRQMRDMKSLGMSGAFMHARAGLETEYLSDEWFTCINECIKEAEKLGMEAWCYDENGWPSGFAGGILLKDKKNLSIAIEERTGTFPKDDDTVIAVYEKNGDETYSRVLVDGGRNDYSILYRHYDERYVDTMNADVTKKFIEVTHEEYKKRIPAEKFGKGKPMPGFFTDEPQYCRWGNPYSDVLPEEFRKAYGYEVYDVLPAIFHDYPGSEKHLYDYNYLCHKLFTNNFIKVIYDWCLANGVELTGHAVEEPCLCTQMWCCGGVMPFYEYETIPGVDYLGRTIQSDSATKQLDSVCCQLGKPKALSEMFACVGWDVSPVELKKIADMQYANGVNLMCQHLYPYSERGQRKRDYPLHHSEHNPWQSALADFDRYFSNLGAALTQGNEYAPILVIHPMHSAYCKYTMDQHGKIPDYLRVADLESAFLDMLNELGGIQLPYHFGDEWLMEKYAHVENGKITVGKCTYEAVYVPYLYSLDANTVRLLKELTDQGGKIYLRDGVPKYVDGAPSNGKLDFLKSTVTFDEIKSLRDVIVTKDGNAVPCIRKMTRLTESGKIVYITNIGDDDLFPVQVSLPAGLWAELDIDSLSMKPVYSEEINGNSVFTMKFSEGESHALVEVSAEEYASLGKAEPFKPESKFIPIPADVRLSEKVTNILTLDYASRSNDGVNYDKPMFLMGIKDNLLRERYNGNVWLKFRYTVDQGFKPHTLRLAIEPMYEEVSVNGNIVKPSKDNWWFDRNIATADISEYTHVGENEIVVRVNHYQRDYVYYVLYSGKAESLRNCLLFDTEIENIYLVGEFGLKTSGVFSDGERNSTLYDGDYVITNEPDCIPSRDAVRGGFPFFAGKLPLEFDYTYTSGGATVLRGDGRFATADISVNGTYVGKMMFDKEMDLSPWLKEGKNTISVLIANSMRNALGPHHRHDPEPYLLGPPTYSFEKEWNGRECKDFLDRYAFVRFGFVK